MSENDGVSVVICCFNSSKRIPATLEHLQKIKTSGIPWEVVLVDNNSEDDTTEKALSIWNINPVTRLKIVSEKNRGLINARITGVKSASYDIISFIDDDNWIESQWIDKVYTLLNSDQSMAACGGSSDAVFEINPPAWFTDFSFYYAVGKQQEESGYVSLQKGYLWGAGLTIKKKAWNYLFENGFNNLLKGRTGKSLTAGEDSEICFALILSGWKLWYEDSLKLQHSKSLMISLRTTVRGSAVMTSTSLSLTLPCAWVAPIAPTTPASANNPVMSFKLVFMLSFLEPVSETNLAVIPPAYDESGLEPPRVTAVNLPRQVCIAPPLVRNLLLVQNL